MANKQMIKDKQKIKRLKLLVGNTGRATRWRAASTKPLTAHLLRRSVVADTPLGPVSCGEGFDGQNILLGIWRTIILRTLGETLVAVT